MNLKNETWLVAVSGGPDSMALVHMMNRKGYKLMVAHVNYKQRSVSDDEETMVKDFCEREGLSFFSVVYDQNLKGNFQANARNFRYQFFSKIIKDEKLMGVMVGHHYDDHIETYLIQKERSIKPSTLGLSSLSHIKGIDVYRPLLHLKKEEIIKYCHDNDIPYSIDASNSNPKYTRNRIRLMDKDLANIEKEFKEDLLKHQEHQEKLESIYNSLSWPVIELDHYRVIDPLYRADLLRMATSKAKAQVHHHSDQFFKELDRQIMEGKSYHDFGSVNLYADEHSLGLLKPKLVNETFGDVESIQSEHIKIASQGNLNQAIQFLDSDFPITLRNVKAGDRIEKEFGTKKVSRYLIDNKIPRYLRESWLVIENASGKLIYVVGMGCDVHHYANIPSTFVVELNLL